MADEVARAIVTAARRCGVHPLQVIDAMPSKSSDHNAISRARAYAAVALDEVYNVPNAPGSRAEHNVNRRQIARMVGAWPGSVDSMVKALRNRIDTGELSCWRRSIFDEVVASIYAEGKRSPPRAPDVARCEKCGGPRSRYSQRWCRSCYRGMSAPGVPVKPVIKPPPPPKPAPAPAPITNGHMLTNSDVLIGDADARVEREGFAAVRAKLQVIAPDGPTVMLPNAAAWAVTACLLKVMPALLPTRVIADKVWGHQVDADHRVSHAAELANQSLQPVGLKIRNMPKFGYSISRA